MKTGGIRHIITKALKFTWTVQSAGVYNINPAISFVDSNIFLFFFEHLSHEHQTVPLPFSLRNLCSGTTPDLSQIGCLLEHHQIFTTYLPGITGQFLGRNVLQLKLARSYCEGTSGSEQGER